MHSSWFLMFFRKELSIGFLNLPNHRRKDKHRLPIVHLDLKQQFKLFRSPKSMVSFQISLLLEGLYID
jgi:hypothetical protein